MSRFLLVLCLAACGAAVPFGGKGSWSPRILGGDEADISEAPYQVSLMLDWKRTGEYLSVCGGTILSEDVILTSAQCPERTKASQWQVRAGSSSSISGGQVIDVASFVMHPLFDDDMDYDVALYFLEKPLLFNSKVSAIQLPKQGDTVPENVDALVTGWGATGVSGNAETELHKIIMPTMVQKECIKTYAILNPISSRMFCAGGKNMSPCYGDFGGPLVIEDKVVGITSWGLGCVLPGYPGVWSKVSEFVDWIEEEIEKNNPEEK